MEFNSAFASKAHLDNSSNLDNDHSSITTQRIKRNDCIESGLRKYLVGKRCKQNFKVHFSQAPRGLLVYCELHKQLAAAIPLQAIPARLPGSTEPEDLWSIKHRAMGSLE